jgi:hypothetical protein
VLKVAKLPLSYFGLYPLLALFEYVVDTSPVTDGKFVLVLQDLLFSPSLFDVCYCSTKK